MCAHFGVPSLKALSSSRETSDAGTCLDAGIGFDAGICFEISDAGICFPVGFAAFTVLVRTSIHLSSPIH